MKITTVKQLNEYVAEIATVVASGTTVEIEWNLWKPSRSHEQNNYLFGVCYPLIAEQMGYTANEIHEYVCGTHFGWVDKKCPKKPSNLGALSQYHLEQQHATNTAREILSER